MNNNIKIDIFFKFTPPVKYIYIYTLTIKYIHAVINNDYKITCPLVLEGDALVPPPSKLEALIPPLSKLKASISLLPKMLEYISSTLMRSYHVMSKSSRVEVTIGDITVGASNKEMMIHRPMEEEIMVQC